MRGLLSVALLCSLFAGAGLAQNRPVPLGLSLIQLMANPEKFDGKLVTVQGFLRIGQEPKHGIEAVLYLHEEDAKNLLGNLVLVTSSDQMWRDREKIDRMYVVLTGSFRAVPGANGAYLPVLKDIQICSGWSDPNHPIGLKRDNSNQK
jgi:hypothetical protein